MKRIFTLNSIIQFVLLMIVWLMMSGHYDVTHIAMGVLSSVGVLLLHIPLRRYYFFHEEVSEVSARLKGAMSNRLRIGRFIYYIVWLLWQIILASFQVAKVVLSPKLPISPSLVRFKTNLPNEQARVILGNSITLTPGTITVSIIGDEFLVHSVMDASFTGILDAAKEGPEQKSSLPWQVAQLYGKNQKLVLSDVEILHSREDMEKAGLK